MDICHVIDGRASPVSVTHCSRPFSVSPTQRSPVGSAATWLGSLKHPGAEPLRPKTRSWRRLVGWLSVC
eukprot:920878-Prymnesium_polylepis.1